MERRRRTIAYGWYGIRRKIRGSNELLSRSRMSMSRMHFEQLADILVRHGVKNAIIEDIANFCNEHNERFDVDRFFEASGYTKTH
jgi:hypothetical protein